MTTHEIDAVAFWQPAVSALVSDFRHLIPDNAQSGLRELGVASQAIVASAYAGQELDCPPPSHDSAHPDIQSFLRDHPLLTRLARPEDPEQAERVRKSLYAGAVVLRDAFNGTLMSMRHPDAPERIAAAQFIAGGLYVPQSLNRLWLPNIPRHTAFPTI